jgi:hypothetical protein
MTHSPGKIEYICRYFIMAFRTQIHKKKFGKKGFHTLQGTLSHRPMTNTSSLKITAAYCTRKVGPSLPCVISVMRVFCVHLVIYEYQQLQQLGLPEARSSAAPFQARLYDIAGGTARPSQYKSSPLHPSPPGGAERRFRSVLFGL